VNFNLKTDVMLAHLIADHVDADFFKSFTISTVLQGKI
jgi:hypothetical protein